MPPPRDVISVAPSTTSIKTLLRTAAVTPVLTLPLNLSPCLVSNPLVFVTTSSAELEQVTEYSPFCVRSLARGRPGAEKQNAKITSTIEKIYSVIVKTLARNIKPDGGTLRFRDLFV